MNKWKVEVRTNRYDGLGAERTIRTDFYYSAHTQPYASHTDGVVSITTDTDTVWYPAAHVEFLHITEIDSAAAAKQREDRISELIAENKKLTARAETAESNALAYKLAFYKPRYNPASYNYPNGNWRF